MRFKRPTQRYGNAEAPVTPYQKAAQIWDERIGAARVQARSWRYAFFGSLALTMGLSGGLVVVAADSRIAPYVVEVDTLGTVQAVGPAVAPYEPADAQIAHYLARFIQNVRALPLDPIVLRKSWDEAYAYATDRAAITLNEYGRASDPFGSVGERTVSVEVTSIVRASDDSFQLKWQEQTHVNGALASTERYTGILNVVTQQPRDVVTLRRNPLGIYVHDLNWSRDLNPGETQ